MVVAQNMPCSSNRKKESNYCNVIDEKWISFTYEQTEVYKQACVTINTQTINSFQ